MDKGALRGYYRCIRDTADRGGLDGKISARLFGLDAWRDAAVIFSYVSFGSEVDTVAIIERALAEGKRAAVPRVTGNRQMEFVEIGGLGALIPNKFGILEPDCGKILVPQAGDAVLVPGLVFSETKHRIGYGGGFYDTYLSGCTGEAVKIGLCYDFQITEGIPGGEYDVPLDMIVTDRRVIAK